MEAQTTGGEEVEQLPVYMVDIEDSCILSLDYLKRSWALGDLRNMTMRIRSVVVPLLELSCPAQVVAARAESVLQRSEMRIRCRLSWRMVGRHGLVELLPAKQLQGGLVVGRTLVQWDKDEVIVLVAKHSDSGHHFQAGTALRMCEEVERMWETVDDKPVVRAASIGVPENLQELLGRISECLDQRQAN